MIQLEISQNHDWPDTLDCAIQKMDHFIAIFMKLTYEGFRVCVESSDFISLNPGIVFLNKPAICIEIVFNKSVLFKVI